MNKIFCMVAAILTMAFSLPFSQAETISLSREEAIAMMDAFENLDFDEVWEWKEFQKENARHTKEWEEKFGRNTRWQGDVTASYVLAYGMMPTYDAPYANPLAVYPDDARLTIPEAKRIASMPQNARVPALRVLNRIMIERNLSPGGSADMLALAYLIDAWRTLSKDLFGEGTV